MTSTYMGLATSRTTSKDVASYETTLSPERVRIFHIHKTQKVEIKEKGHTAASILTSFSAVYIFQFEHKSAFKKDYLVSIIPNFFSTWDTKGGPQKTQHF